MAVKVWNVGDVLTAADMNSWTVPKAAYTTTTQHWSNNTVTNVTELVVAADANAVYILRLSLVYEAPTAGDAQIAWTLPAGASQVNTSLVCLPTTAASGSDIIITAGTSAPGFGGLGAGNTTAFKWESVLTTSSTAGNVQLRAAQLVTSAVSDFIIDAGSFLEMTRVG